MDRESGTRSLSALGGTGTHGWMHQLQRLIELLNGRLLHHAHVVPIADKSYHPSSSAKPARCRRRM